MENSEFPSHLARATALIRKKGLGHTITTLLSRLGLHLEIKMRGQGKTVNLDGCSFPLAEVPNTSMKLNLLRGSYEVPERSAARRYVKSEWPVIELGGCIGVVACITNKSLNQPKKHIVVEANPIVIPQLEANRILNQCSFSILNRALAYDAASVRFMPSPDFWGTSVYESGNSRPSVDVPTMRLGKIVEDAGFESFALICDIEGQEYELVRNELDTLRKAEVIIMELHPRVVGENRVSEMLQDLRTIGFEITERMDSVVVMCKH